MAQDLVAEVVHTVAESCCRRIQPIAIERMDEVPLAVKLHKQAVRRCKQPVQDLWLVAPCKVEDFFMHWNHDINV